MPAGIRRKLPLGSIRPAKSAHTFPSFRVLSGAAIALRPLVERLLHLGIPTEMAELNRAEVFWRNGVINGDGLHLEVRYCASYEIDFLLDEIGEDILMQFFERVGCKTRGAWKVRLRVIGGAWRITHLSRI